MKNYLLTILLWLSMLAPMSAAEGDSLVVGDCRLPVERMEELTEALVHSGDKI